MKSLDDNTWVYQANNGFTLKQLLKNKADCEANLLLIAEEMAELEDRMVEIGFALHNMVILDEAN